MQRSEVVWRRCNEGPWEVGSHGYMRFCYPKDFTSRRRRKDGDLIKFRPNQAGYHMTVLKGYYRRRMPLLLHKFVARYFVGERPRGLTINHIDGDKGNNSASNLEYMTLQDNINHAVRNGLYYTTDPAKLQAARDLYPIIKSTDRISDMLHIGSKAVCDAVRGMVVERDKQTEILETQELYATGWFYATVLAEIYGLSYNGITSRLYSSRQTAWYKKLKPAV